MPILSEHGLQPSVVDAQSIVTNLKVSIFRLQIKGGSFSNEPSFLITRTIMIVENINLRSIWRILFTILAHGGIIENGNPHNHVLSQWIEQTVSF